MSLFCTFCATINIGEWRISLKWLVGINLTSHGLNLTSSKIINFTSCCENSQNFEPKSGFKPIRYLHEPSMKPLTKLFQIHSMHFSCKVHVSSFMCAVIVCHDLEKYEECVTKMFQKQKTFDFLDCNKTKLELYLFDVSLQVCISGINFWSGKTTWNRVYILHRVLFAMYSVFTSAYNYTVWLTFLTKCTALFKTLP